MLVSGTAAVTAVARGVGRMLVRVATTVGLRVGRMPMVLQTAVGPAVERMSTLPIGGPAVGQTCMLPIGGPAVGRTCTLPTAVVLATADRTVAGRSTWRPEVTVRRARPVAPKCEVVLVARRVGMVLKTAEAPVRSAAVG